MAPISGMTVVSRHLSQIRETPIGAINALRLMETWRCNNTIYVHPEDCELVGQYMRGRGMQRYFTDLPGFKDAVLKRGVDVYLDMGAGYGRAAEEIAQTSSALHVFAISRSDFSEARPLPPNMTYLVSEARDILDDMIITPDVITDLYGAFTYDVYNQIDLMRLYMKALAQGGQTFIRFDGDHMGVVNQSGTLMLFSEWLVDLHLPEVKVIEGPNPTGPTGLVSVVILQKISRELTFPNLKLSGIKQFADDVVPFVVYGM